jgi:hypothetical protein
MGCDVEPRWGSRVTGAVIPGCDTQHHRINPEGVAQLGTKRVSIGGWHCSGTVRVAFAFLKHRGTEDTEKRLAPTQSLCELCAL